MATVQTTAGPVDSSKLGRTLSHEHLHCGAEGLRRQWPHLYDRNAELAQSEREIRRVQEWGVETICDPSCMDLDRDVDRNIEISRRTGMRFVMATGVYGVSHAAISIMLTFDPKWPDNLTELLLHDLQVGIQETSVRAGFLKCAADHPGLTPQIEAVHRAVARASIASGAPIMAHSSPVTKIGLLQMQVFREEGVDPERVVMAHTGDTDDLGYIERLLAEGCYIGLDRFGLENILSDERRLATVMALIDRGYANRMMLGQDSVAQADPGRPVGLPSWTITRIFEHTIPYLTEHGVDPAVVEAMIGTNVHTWLAGESGDFAAGRHRVEPQALRA